MFLTMMAVMGLVWLYVTFSKLRRRVKKAWNTEGTYIQRFERAFEVFRTNNYRKDLTVSLIFTLGGAFAFAGVTGMIYGLLASAAISVMIWLSAKSKWVNKFTELAD